MKNRRATYVIPSEIAEQLRHLLPAQTDAMVMNRLGISFTTWMKIKTGQGIRLSTARRMLERVSRAHNIFPDAMTLHDLQSSDFGRDVSSD